MSNPITAVWQDVRLEDIRKAVQLKTGTVPFLLMPVRIETRFMEVQKQVLSENVAISAVLNFIAQLNVEVIDLTKKNIANQQEIKALTNELAQLKVAIGKLDVVITKEKSWLKQLVNELTVDILSMAKKQNFDPKTLINILTEIQKVIDLLKVTKEFAAADAQKFIEAHAGILTKIQTLTNPRKTPFINVKNKKDLYNYVQKTLDETTKFYQNTPRSISPIKEIFKNQTLRIAEIHKQFKQELEKISINLSNIHKDESWRSFVGKINADHLTNLRTSFIAFDRQVLPKLNTLPQPAIALDSRDIHFHGIQTLTFLKRYNANPTTQKFEDSKVLQNRLLPRVETLKKVLGNNPNFSSEQAPELKAIYQQIAGQMTIAKNQVKQFRPINNSQQIGIKTIVDFIDNQAVGAFKGILESPIVQPIVTPTKVHELWVRVYPDDIFVQTHDDELTKDEILVGKNFWKTWWACTNNSELEIAAFRALARSGGIRRAGWIARVLNPKKVTSPQNPKSLATKPSEIANGMSKILEGIYTQIQPITADLNKKPEEILAKINVALFTSFVNQINTSLIKFKTIKFELNHVMQKFQTATMRLGSVLNSMIDKRNALSVDNGNILKPNLEALSALADAFQKVINTAEKIEVVPFDVFVLRLKEPFIYPNVATKDKVWSKAPHSDALPDRFVVITVQNNVYTHLVVGEKVPESLQLGINPGNPDENAFHLDENGDLQIDEKMLWMTEYSEALKNGMAISVPLTADQAKAGFDQVFVLGIKDKSPVDSQTVLSNLIRNHTYSSEGMALLKVGTPTNNTHQDKAGFNPENDLEKIFNIEVKEEVITPRKFIGEFDSERLSRFLGLSPGLLNHVVDFQNTQVSNAFVMNRALWNGTMGHHLEEMFDGVFTYDNIKRTENFFTDNVVGRGFLPSVRIGEQPYGILPTTAFSQLELYPSSVVPPLTFQETKDGLSAILEPKLQQRFDLRLYNFLNELQKIWSEFSVMHADILDKGIGEDVHQKNYMNMLGLHATSLNYHFRYGANVGKGPQDISDNNSVATNFSVSDKFGPYGFFEIFKEQMKDGIYNPSFYLWSEQSTEQMPKFQKDDQRYNEVFGNLANSRIFNARFLQTNPELKGKIIDTLPLSDKLLSNDYIKWLLDNDPSAILASNQWKNLPDRSLLFMLLRQSLMQTYQEAALAILQAEKTITETKRRSLGSGSEYLSYDYDKAKRAFSTKWHYLMKNLSDLKGLGRLEFKNNPFFSYMIAKGGARPAMSFYVFTKQDSMLKNPLFLGYPNKLNHLKHIEKIDQVRDAFKVLQTLPTKELEILLAEHIDLCTYRLDAWKLGFVNSRLRQNRIISPSGINLGAFAWVENLRPDGNRMPKIAAEIPNELATKANGVIYEDPDNQGFIHGPSIHHGITAAILRAGYIGDKNRIGGGSRLSINLSSERVRMAMDLISGLQNGMDLGAILGFQFERGLHERYNMGVELDKYIQPLRKLFPLVLEVEDTKDNKKADYQTHVVNGNTLLTEVFKAVDWHNNNTEKTLATILSENNFSKCPDFIKKLNPNPNPNELLAIIKEIDHIANGLDALGDLVMSEGVYQIVKGNHVRAAAALASLSPDQKTATSIPRPDIIDTPRTGTVVTHRVGMSLAVKDTLALPTGWNNPMASPRATAEPSLNFWLGTLLGNPQSTVCEVIIKPVGVNQQSLFVNLDYLKWQPIDYFFMASDENLLIQNIILEVRKRENLADETSVLPMLKSKNGGRSFYEMDWIIGQIRQLLNGAKYMNDSDYLGISERPKDSLNTGNFNDVQFLTRAKNAQKSLSDIVKSVENLTKIKQVIDGLEMPENVVLTALEIKNLNDILYSLSKFGISNVIPAKINPIPKELPALIRQVITNYKEALKRNAEAINFVNSITLTMPKQAIVEIANDTFKAVFGKGFLALPQYKINNFALLNDQIQNAKDITKGLLRNAKSLGMEKWLHGIAKVREKMYAVEMLSTGSESVTGKNLAILPTQTSFDIGDYWLGIEFPESYIPKGDKLSILVVQPENFTENSVGILIDEWVEILPNKSETTGVTFHYNQPNARPPQSLLLAVNPRLSGNWNWDDLVYTIRDTLAMAKTRGVEPDHLEKSRLSQVLPSIVTEVVPSQVQDDDGNALGVQVALDFVDNK
jgi:hypothetical protein